MGVQSDGRRGDPSFHRSSLPVINLLSVEGLQRMLVNLVPNFVEFPPLGSVLVCLVGIAVAERTGLITAALRMVVMAAPLPMALTALAPMTQLPRPPLQHPQMPCRQAHTAPPRAPPTRA